MEDSNEFPLPVKLTTQTGIKLTADDGEDIVVPAGSFLLITAEQARQIEDVIVASRQLIERLLAIREARSSAIGFDYQLSSMIATTEMLAKSWNDPGTAQNG